MTKSRGERGVAGSRVCVGSVPLCHCSVGGTGLNARALQLLQQNRVDVREDPLQDSGSRNTNCVRSLADGELSPSERVMQDVLEFYAFPSRDKIRVLNLCRRCQT